jgi:hypothetical protein
MMMMMMMMMMLLLLRHTLCMRVVSQIQGAAMERKAHLALDLATRLYGWIILIITHSMRELLSLQCDFPKMLSTTSSTHVIEGPMSRLIVPTTGGDEPSRKVAKNVLLELSNNSVGNSEP